MSKGIGASAGVGIGRVMIIKEQSLSYTPKQVKDTEAELTRYRKAVAEFCDDTMQKSEAVKESVGEKESEILLGHIVMIQDPYMNGEIEKLIQGGKCAESALEEICDMFIGVFSSADDELTNQRAADVKDIKDAILRNLLGIQEADISKAPQGTVIVAHELTPSMTAGINKQNIVGIVTETGGKTSHSAILARALEIPAVLSVDSFLSECKEGDAVIVDGSEGVAILKPHMEQVSAYTLKRDAYIKERKALGKFIGKKTLTADGNLQELVCNIGKPEDANNALECDGEGVGLFRTEFLFMESTSEPTEEEQFEAYKKVALIMKDKPVIIRTLDIGGDKEIPYLGIVKEENPFLGFRAVRYCLKKKNLYKNQLRALLRASAYGDIRIMVPLVTCIEELRQVKEIIEEIKKDLLAKNIEFNPHIKVGVMIETAAASIVADLFAKEADFFSIGTNDLTQYTMCVDRGNKDVAYLYSAYNPAVIRSIKRIIECAKEEKIPVGMCGESAADPLLIPLLISFGLDEYSVSPTSVLSTRKTISEWSKQEADRLAEKALNCATEQEVEALLKAAKK